MFLRTWYQTSGTSDAGVDVCLRVDEDRSLPRRRVAADTLSRWLVSCTVRSRRSVTCFNVSSTVAPGHARGDNHRPEGESPGPRRDPDAGTPEVPAATATNHQEDNQRAALQRPFRQVWTNHCFVSIRTNFLAGPQGLYARGQRRRHPGSGRTQPRPGSGPRSGSSMLRDRHSPRLWIDDPHRCSAGRDRTHCGRGDFDAGHGRQASCALRHRAAKAHDRQAG